MQSFILIYCKGPTGDRTQINRFKVYCTNRYTIGPIKMYTHIFK